MQLIELPGIGHTPYKGIDTDLDTTDMVWQFMLQPPRNASSVVGGGEFPGAPRTTKTSGGISGSGPTVEIGSVVGVGLSCAAGVWVLLTGGR